MLETLLADARDVALRLYAALAAGDADALDEILWPDFVGRAADGLSFAASGEQRDAGERLVADRTPLRRHR
jgi:ketosteroid isomerase-like protein